MSFLSSRIHPRLQVLALCVLPTLALAQTPSQFESLAMPAVDVGTCMPIPGDTSSQRGRRLVMKSIPSGRQREMTVMLGIGNGMIAYYENAFGMNGTHAGAGTSVNAILDSSGVFFGQRTETAVAYPDSIVPTDAASLRAMMKQASTSVSTRALDDAEESKVRDLAAFVRKRCSV